MFGLDVFSIQLYFVTGSIAFRLNAFIMGPLLKFLGIVEIFLTSDYQFS